MSAVRRTRVNPFGALVVGLVGVLAVLPAQSRTPVRGDDNGACAARVQELEAEVRALREQLRTQPGDDDQRAAGARLNTSTRAGAMWNLPKGRSLTRSCDPPFEYDRNGIKHYNPACFGAENLAKSCTVPYEYTTAGIKVYNRSCLSTTLVQASCDPPFAYDARGVKDYKRECLK